MPRNFLDSKIVRIHDAIDEEGIGGLVLGNWDNIRYATGFRWIPVIQSKAGQVYFAAVVPKDKPPILIVSRGDYERARSDYGIQDVRMYESGTANLRREISRTIEDYHLDKGTVGIDDNYFPADLYNEITSGFPQTKFTSSRKAMTRARTNKLPEEVEFIRKATKITKASIEAAFEVAKPGVSESELSARAHYEAIHEGAEAVLNVIVASGVNSGRKHYQRFATERKIQDGEFVLIDMSAICEGYLSDITRTVVVGKENQKQSEIMKLVSQALEDGIATVRPGLEAWKIDEVMRRTIWDAGYGEYYDLTVWPAHGIGLSHFEDPLISSREGFRSSMKLEPGMVLSIEPGIYLDDGGVRKEDVVLVTESGHEKL